MQAANLLAEKAVNIRSEARSAYTGYRSNYDIARHYKNSVLPLRVKIEEESLLTYNGMITNTFELLSDTREKLAAQEFGEAHELLTRALEFHPDDATPRGLIEGDTVRVHNDRGGFLARLRVSGRALHGAGGRGVAVADRRCHAAVAPGAGRRPAVASARGAVA